MYQLDMEKLKLTKVVGLIEEAVIFVAPNGDAVVATRVSLDVETIDLVELGEFLYLEEVQNGRLSEHLG